ncbi:MAG TPA: energy transducer TonB [Bacteroidales bacterium]|nr:energy transducer TonB [Bacteroidales bacterium]HPR58842.1 energy transducer TonB [Bacteroidales bacterium]HRW97526.1 energy transducer TonB [Bacteroidales bacterium]
MEEKKSKKADLENKKTIFLQIGFVIALAIVLLAFNYKTYEKSSTLDIQVQVDNSPEEIIPITKQEVKPPPPPPPAQITIINIVEDDVLVEDEIVIDVETDQTTEIPDFVPVVEEEEEVEEMEIFTVVESMPEFPGGDAARMKFLQENIKYPQLARESGIQGTVYVTFVVETDGKVTDVRVLRGIGGGCDEEAVRVIQSMPRWIPGKQRGKPVRVQFNMPIRFTLQG